MSSDWINKAKEAAKQAAMDAKKLAESAKNANYGEIFDKTKNMAKQAAEEAKKAAGTIMSKDNKDKVQNPGDDLSQPDTDVETPSENTSVDPSVIIDRATEETNAQEKPVSNPLVIAKIEQVEKLLDEIKQLLK